VFGDRRGRDGNRGRREMKRHRNNPVKKRARPAIRQVISKPARGRERKKQIHPHWWGIWKTSIFMMRKTKKTKGGVRPWAPATRHDSPDTTLTFGPPLGGRSSFSFTAESDWVRRRRRDVYGMFGHISSCKKKLYIYLYTLCRYICVYIYI